jgi:hypothetical protein
MSKRERLVLCIFAVVWISFVVGSVIAHNWEVAHQKLVETQAQVTERSIRDEYVFMGEAWFEVTRNQAKENLDELHVLVTEHDDPYETQSYNETKRDFEEVDIVKQWFDAGREVGKSEKPYPTEPTKRPRHKHYKNRPVHVITPSEYNHALELRRQHLIDHLDDLYWQKQHKEEHTA